MAEEAQVVSDEERDATVYKLRLAGVGARTVAAQFGLTVGDVNDICDRLMPRVDNRYEARCVGMDLEVLERLQAKFLAQALNGDAASAHMCLKVLEHRRETLGYAAPVKIDATALTASAAPAETTTGELLRVLRELREQKAAPPSCRTRPATDRPGTAPDAPARVGRGLGRRKASHGRF